MTTQSPIVRLLYFIMFRLMDLESLSWTIADFIIMPIAQLRRFVAFVIARLLKLKEAKQHAKE